eukprot:526886-Prorocentrum_minimum.AAC.1
MALLREAWEDGAIGAEPPPLQGRSASPPGLRPTQVQSTADVKGGHADVKSLSTARPCNLQMLRAVMRMLLRPVMRIL